VLGLMTAGLSAIAGDLLNIVTRGQYVEAAGVVTWTAVGVFFYGIYLLTSIGLNITSHTQYYPVSTAIGAVVNIGLNVLWIPRYGIIGAAWANGAAYGVQAAVAYRLSQRFYPVRYEYGRVARAIAAALLAYAAARLAPSMPPLASGLVRGAIVVAVMSGLLWLTGFFNAEEVRALNALRRRRPAPAPVAPVDATELAGEIVAVEVREDIKNAR
jgi:O-antigen/teichoic acid export membrane protein